MFDFARLRNDLLALALLAATVFVGLSLISYDPADPPAQVVYPERGHAVNLCGSTGAVVSHALRTAFGLGAYAVLLSMVILDIRLFSRRPIPQPMLQAVGMLLFLTAICVGLQLFNPGLGSSPIIGSGGYLGAWGVVLLEREFSTIGIGILSGSAAVSGLLLADETLLFRIPILGVTAATGILVRLVNPSWIGQAVQAVGRVTAKRKAAVDLFGADLEAGDIAPAKNELEPTSTTTEDFTAQCEDDPKQTSDSQELIKVNPPVTSQRSSREEVIARLDASSVAPREEEYQLPDLDLLEEPEDFPYDLLAKKARIAAITLEKTFHEFGLNVRVKEIDTGPVVTQFELELEAGLRLSKVTRLADDLAIALRVPSVRVVAPIPGKNTVGVEVPNDKQVMVRLRELIEACDADIENKRIPIFLGKDVSGRPLAVDLTKMPHLLIAGRTGTGKSVCLNTLILSMLMTRDPDQVKMLMIDPKMVELSPYRRVPHLMHPVITDMKKAEAVLAWAVDKMEERYDLLARCGVRHLDSYNRLGKEKALERLGIDADSEEAESIPDQMPYIVIIADEMADMMMTSGKDVEGHIIRLAQKSRAVGIHLVLATQKPTVDVLTGLIKSNLPARISFQVASRTDSRVVLDEMGAERLLGNGDMLYLAPGTSNLTRAQGTYVSDEEINAIIDFFGDSEPQYNSELTQLSTTASGDKAGLEAVRNRDELYERAVDVVIREGRGSVSLLQRCLGIGYGRAARLIDYMAEDGIVGDYNGSQAREVLFSFEQWEAMKSGQELEDAPV